jgi:hypothetical protein
MRERNIGLMILLLVLSIFFIFGLSGCADTAQITYLNPTEHTYGFWGGTWHGIIMAPSFVGSLIWDDVSVYAVNNNGAWYDFGYVGGFFFMIKLIGYALKGARKVGSK